MEMGSFLYSIITDSHDREGGCLGGYQCEHFFPIPPGYRNPGAISSPGYFVSFRYNIKTTISSSRRLHIEKRQCPGNKVDPWGDTIDCMILFSTITEHNNIINLVSRAFCLFPISPSAQTLRTRLLCQPRTSS